MTQVQPEDDAITPVLRAAAGYYPEWAVVPASPSCPGPEPVDLERHRVRRKARADGTIGEYHLVA